MVHQTALASPLPPNSNPYPCGFPSGLSYISHAFEWQEGFLVGLGPLSGGYCSSPSSTNTRREIVGNAEIDDIDPILGVREMHAVLWDDGNIKDLGTLGGNESAAYQQRWFDSSNPVEHSPDDFQLF